MMRRRTEERSKFEVSWRCHNTAMAMYTPTVFASGRASVPCSGAACDSRNLCACSRGENFVADVFSHLLHLVIHASSFNWTSEIARRMLELEPS